MVSKAKLRGHASFQMVKGWVLSVILGVHSSRFVVETDFFFFLVLVLLCVMLSPGRRREDFRTGKMPKGGSFLKQSLPLVREQAQAAAAVSTIPAVVCTHPVKLSFTNLPAS